MDGSPLVSPLLRLLLGVQFRLDLRMGNGNQTPHKIRELAEVARNILGGMARVSWLLAHTLLEGRVQQWCVLVNV